MSQTSLQKKIFCSRGIKNGMSAGLLILCGGFLIKKPNHLYATTLPESYPLVEVAEKEALPPSIDPNLDSWLKLHANKNSPFELDPQKFNEFVEKQDAVSKLFLKIEHHIQSESKETLRPLVDQVIGLIDEEQKSPRQNLLTHPLIAFVYLALLESQALSPSEKLRFEGEISKIGTRTCPQKEMFLAGLTRDSVASMDEATLKTTFARLENFRSMTFRRQALQRFVLPLTSQKIAAIGAPLYKAVEPFSGVIQSHPHLKAYFEKLPSDDQLVDIPEFNRVRTLAAKKQCGSAKDLLIQTLKKLQNERDEQTKKSPSQSDELSAKDIDTLEKTVNAGKAVDGCIRQKNNSQRAEFWKGLVQLMEETYGFAGWVEAKLRIAYIAWSDSDYEEANPLFEEIRQKVSAAPSSVLSDKFRSKSVAKALFSLGRIAERELEPARAAKYYEEYLAKYAREENFEEVMMALVLIHIDQGNWAPGITVLDSLIQEQSKRPLDERSTTAMSFALFWNGHIHLQTGRVKAAEKSWQRLATEYYSTYYGAMGHYMLEQLTGKRLVLQPARTAPFRMHDFREAFPPEERLQIRRAEALMRLGLKKEAICELEELDGSEDKPERLLLRSLMLHAAGQWLDAIKAYDALPRSFRHRLPSGFERILFPVRFNEEVRSLADKAQVDPDLVLAIMRQESVFNPLARSPVGAMGLMQLMPATALLETARLETGYVSQEERKQIKQSLSNPLTLFDPMTNLKIGIHHVRSLLSIYNSPVYVLSAYNASPAAARKWITTIPTKDVLIFIEKIPYKETRAYVRLVLRNYFYYKRFYGNPDEKMHHLNLVASHLLAKLKDISPTASATNH
jgi:tetratricopeptide (TPR) repeat protein